MALALLLLGVGGWIWRAKKMEARARPGAYVIPLEAGSRAGGAWFTQALKAPRMFTEGGTLKVPEGARVRIVYANGSIEDVSGPVRMKLSGAELRGETVEDFLAVRLDELANLTPGVTNAAAGAVRIMSPVGVTRFTNPAVVWAARPGINYDVAVIDPADPMAPPRVAERVRPPVTIEQLKSTQKPRLKTDRLYEVYVRESDNVQVVGAARILVSKDAGDGVLPVEPADLLREAVEAMTKRPTRTGDAWLALSKLPADWADGELAVRLRLRIAIELGLVDEFARVQEAAWRLVKK
ncbi:MAG: hypothetical protein QM760_15265 [Nibricoccus sp.]